MKYWITCLILTFASAVHAANLETPEVNSDDALVAQAERMMKDQPPATTPAASVTATSVTATPTTATPTTGATEPKESDIPLFLEAKKADKGLTSVAMRLGLSLALIAVVGGALIYASKRWTRTKDKGGNKARIEMMHQLHMGPRKSLALIRVSGEVMLVGITDHAINMIKPVTLIDDELEGVANKDFNNFLEAEFSIEDVRSALNARA